MILNFRRSIYEAAYTHGRMSGIGQRLKGLIVYSPQRIGSLTSLIMIFRPLEPNVVITRHYY